MVDLAKKIEEGLVRIAIAIGVYDSPVGTHTHHFDVCEIYVTVSDNSSLEASERIFHLAWVDTF